MELIKNLFTSINKAISNNDVVTLDTTQLDIITLMQQRGFNVKSIVPFNTTLSTNSASALPYSSVTSSIGSPPKAKSGRAWVFYGDISSLLYSNGVISDLLIVNSVKDRDVSSNTDIMTIAPRVTENKALIFNLNKVIFSNMQIYDEVGSGCFASFTGYMCELAL